MTKTLIHFKQCQNTLCRFRFPASITEHSSINCPICGDKTQVENQVTVTTKNRRVHHPKTTIIIDALLDNIRSGYNVGSIFRTADGSGINHLYLAGITPTPNHSKVAKTALGAQDNVAWTHHLNALELLEELKSIGHQIWAIENNVAGESLFDIQFPIDDDSPILIIVGNEIAGVDPAILDYCDRIFFLPMLGTKRSLNVVIAFGIAGYYLRFGDSNFVDW